MDDKRQGSPSPAQQPWLKPCPLCGGEAHQVGHVENGVITTWVIFCASCEIELTGDSDKIVAIWNAGAKE